MKRNNKQHFFLIIIATLLTSLILLSCSDYGDKEIFNEGELYYKSPITKEEVNKLGNFLVQEQFFGGRKISVQILKENNKYQFRMVVQKGAENDESKVPIYKLFAEQISQAVFNGAPVEYHLCDEYFKTLKVITP